MLECQGISSKARLLWRNQIRKGLKEMPTVIMTRHQKFRVWTSITFGNLKSCSSEQSAFCFASEHWTKGFAIIGKGYMVKNEGRGITWPLVILMWKLFICKIASLSGFWCCLHRSLLEKWMATFLSLWVLSIYLVAESKQRRGGFFFTNNRITEHIVYQRVSFLQVQWKTACFSPSH